MPEEKVVRVLPDYDCYPTWVRQGTDYDNVSPDTLPVSDGLARELDRWGDEYDATLDRDNPIESGFPTPEEKEDFAVRGEELARRLQRELGATAQVVYFDIRTSEHVRLS